MPDIVLANYLQADTVDTTAAAVFAANPGMLWHENQIPKYDYTSLYTLMSTALAAQPGGSGLVDLADFQRRITGPAGENETVASLFIRASTVAYESVTHFDNIPINQTGAEGAVVNLFFSQLQPIEPAMFGNLKLIELRTRMLLDYSIRGNMASGNGGICIPQSYLQVDPTINGTESTGIFLCKWLGFVKEPTEYEIVSRYKIAYLRQFGNVIINIPH